MSTYRIDGSAVNGASVRPGTFSDGKPGVEMRFDYEGWAQMTALTRGAALDLRNELNRIIEAEGFTA
jgi:hypothetical protein